MDSSARHVVEVHTSDRHTFKKCRQLWDFTSPIRRNLRPVDEPGYFSFGRSIHKGLEVWYNPELWNEKGMDDWTAAFVADQAITVFIQNENDALRKRKKALAPAELSYEEHQEWRERRELGEAMLQHYFVYSQANDFGVWLPRHVEVPFEVELWDGVVYKGIIDLIAERIADNTLWVWDHKSAASMDWGYHAPFEIDPQVGCVPLSTQALTPSGWKSHHEISKGDLVLAHHPEGFLTWSVVDDVIVYGPQQVGTLEGKSLNVTTTPNHEWVTTARRGYKKRRSDEFPNWDGDLVLSAPYRMHGNESNALWDITPDEAALIGWILGDGWISRHRSSGYEVCISQSKYVSEIDALVQRLKLPKDPGRSSAVRSSLSTEPTVRWRFSTPYIRKLWERAGLSLDQPDKDLIPFVLGLTSTAREAFCQAARLAEGSGDTKVHQNPGPRQEAFRLAFFLEGTVPSVQTKGDNRFVTTSGRRRTQRLKWTPKPLHEPVWCLKTRYGNWVMRQDDGFICVTGNSYAWVLWTMGYPIYGFLFNELAKKAPTKPEPMKSRRKGLLFSVNKQLDATPSLYRQALREAKEPEEPYSSFLRYLENRQDPFFRRTEIERTEKELEILGLNVADEAADMTRNPRIYPNATRDNCHGCKFRAPCLLIHEGGDFEYLLRDKSQYTDREDE